MTKLILFNKPYGVNSQFTGDTYNETLSAYISMPGFYAAGRLDKKSEGLLLLTNDGKLQHSLCTPNKNKFKYYWVLVEGSPSNEDLLPLIKGINLGDFHALPAKASIIQPPLLWPRVPPVRYRKLIKDTWLDIGIQEGKNHQIRRMTAAIGYPTLRLVRYKIDGYTLGDLQPGQWKNIPIGHEETGFFAI